MKFFIKSFLLGTLLMLMVNVTVFAQDQFNVYRVYNPQSQEHLYTANEIEKNSLIANGWKDERIGWISASSGQPVYRLYYGPTGQHLFTSDSNEIQVLITQNGWTLDFNGDPLFYSSGNYPVYRLYHPGILQHHLTTEENEYRTLGNQGWNPEGIAFYGVALEQNANQDNNNNVPPETNPNPDKGTDNKSESNILVAYFSATNNTHQVATVIAENIGATVYRIEAENPYTAADLNYGDNNSRCQKEQNDKSVRPAIRNALSDLNQYSAIFIGYPIWFNQEPRIIDTFLESYDLSGKTIIPFCTSGSSGIANSISQISPLAPKANWLAGKRLTPNNEQEIQELISNIKQELPD